MIGIDKVTSFTVDHSKLNTGVYIARSCRGVTTYDIRITRPNVEPCIPIEAYHSLEHLFATWFRSSKISDDVVAFDGMACLTGFYLILFDKSTGPYTEYEVRDLLLKAISWILLQNSVPATTPQTCGNYLSHDLHKAQYVAYFFYDRLKYDFHTEYPKIEVTLDNGMKFADS